MPSTRSKKREKDEPSVEEVKEEPKGKKKKTKDTKGKEKVEKVAEVESGSSKKKGEQETAEMESNKAESVGASVTKIVRITVEACNSWQKFKRMAKEYLEYFVTFFPSIETSINPEKPRRGAFNIRLYHDINSETKT